MGVIGEDTRKIDAKLRHKIKQFVKELAQYRGRGTELVTVYVPAGYSLDMIINQLQDEQGTATNIKSKQTRTNVTDALERMIQHLKTFKQTLPNGMAAFSGNVAEREGQSNVKVWSIEMPVPSSQRLYRCDKEFILDPLRELVEHENTYGLVVLDRRDAMLGLLKGKTIIPLVQTHSEVPGKHKSGGQCLAKGTLVQTGEGIIIPIEKSHNPLSVMGVAENSVEKSPILDKWETVKERCYTITTKYPRCVIESSKDHVFFVHKEGMQEIPAEELAVGDRLVMPERIGFEGNIQKLQKKNFVAYATTETFLRWFKEQRLRKKLSQKRLATETGLGQSTISAFERGKLDLSENVLKRIASRLHVPFVDFAKRLKKKREIRLPDEVTPQLAQIVGYYLGDGSRENDRLTFFEQREQVALAYRKHLKELFNVTISLSYRKSKNYHQIRVYGQPIVKLLDDNFPEVRLRTLPEKILLSPSDVVGSFLRGLFDAEGYISRGRVGIGMNNRELIQALQVLFLRFGIVSSFLSYDNRKSPYSDKTRYSLDISDKESLALFARHVGFTATDKMRLLKSAVHQKEGWNRVRQVLASGNEVRRIIEQHGHTLELFPKVSAFFNNGRKMSKHVFRSSVVDAAPEPLRAHLQKIVDMPLIPTEIVSIQIREANTEMIDIATGNQNFIANGVLVHNSAVRFERLREGATIEHFKKIADYMKDQFLPMGEALKGIILGGPGVTINKFMGHDYITGDLKKKILGTKDLSYTGEFGLQELLEKSEDLLASEEVAEEKQTMQRFFHELSKDTGKAAYGRDDVLKAIEYGAADIVLLSEAVDDDAMERFEREAETTGASVKIVSTQTREGVQLKEMGGIAAILRYPLGQ